MYTVYKHTSPSGKCYIGITQQEPKLRWLNGNGYAKCPLFFNAIKKYGWENIRHEILQTGLARHEAEAEEVRLIAQYRSNEREYEYNLANGGNAKGKHSADTRRKIGLKGMGRKQSPQTIQKRIVRGERHYLYGKHLSDETRIRLSRAKMGQIVAPQIREKISQTMTGRKQTDEHKVKAARARWVPVEQYSGDGVFLRRFEAVKAAAEAVGGNHSKIVMCCRGKRRTAYGFIWRYAVA